MMRKEIRQAVLSLSENEKKNLSTTKTLSFSKTFQNFKSKIVSKMKVF